MQRTFIQHENYSNFGGNRLWKLEIEVVTEGPDLFVQGSSSEWLLLGGGLLSPSILKISPKRPSSISYTPEFSDPARDAAR